MTGTVMSPLELKGYLAEQKAIIDAHLQTFIAQACLSDRMRAPVAYAISVGGKRVRPVLCLAACTSVGGDPRTALPAACALEMIHTYSLIHDDLPALDDDDMRRGQPACHVKFGEATAILAGDALLTMAFEVLGEAGVNAAGHAAPLWLEVVRIVAHAAGCRGMIEGQARDLAFEGVKLEQEPLEAMHRLKTGALIKVAAHCGAVLGQGTALEIEHLTRFADRVGLAFQVVDDVLNVKGDPAVTGKSVGSDMARQKNTYPALLGLGQSEGYARDLIDQGLQALMIFDNKADPLRAIARYVVERDR